jgi:two-component system sensor histidine kinase VanS
MLKKQISVYEDLVIKKSINLKTGIADQLSVNGDKSLLQKVIDNLVVNAIHYSPAKSNIFINAWRENEKVCFTIENTGVHIKETDLPKLFDAFYRVDQSRNRQTGGSGLGLYIVKMILDQHKAGYEVENTSAGVQFTVSFR